MSKTLISEYVKNLRRESGLSINQFAILHGISHSQVSKYESGVLDQPSLLIAAKFCKAFDLSPIDFSNLIYHENSIIDDASNLCDSLNHLIGLDSEIDSRKYVYDFFDNCHDIYGLTNLSDGPAPDVNSDCLHGEKVFMCQNNSGSNIIIEDVKYKKIQKGKKNTNNNELEYAILLPFAYTNYTRLNFLILTPSKVLFDMFSLKKFGSSEAANNIILLRYKKRNTPEYKVIAGHDFLRS